MLQIHNLDAGYGKLQILQSVSLELAEGETVALVGANGAGKTTLLKAIMNLAQVLGGSIIFNGVLLNGKPWYKVAQMGISFVLQKHAIFAPLTVLENLEVGAYRIRKDSTKRQKNLRTTLGFFPHLESILSQSAGYLSGGEQKMLSIACGLMASPEILLLDEPSLGLAPIMAESIFTTIGQIASAYPSIKGIIIVEQNAFLALEIARKGYVLENGQVVLEGPSEKLMEDSHVKEAYLAA